MFLRSSSEKVSILYLCLLFSLGTCSHYEGHSHKLLYKIVRRKQYLVGPTVSQIIFTFVFSLYGMYVLVHTHTLMACIMLHAQCNLLGSPSINNCTNQIYDRESKVPPAVRGGLRRLHGICILRDFKCGGEGWESTQWGKRK